ncbi:vWA domain-containing protein [Caldimonas sp. KR1-144]|uniref:vWA domain-containing protein n=1 Tax=Caldimonas sp. KR1-144 TaxID=3400911 RepID=UPI003C117AB4
MNQRQRLRAWRGTLAGVARRHASRLALAAAAALVALAWWNPSVPGSRRQIELLLVFDITQSMAVADQWSGGETGQPGAVSRLAKARQLVQAVLPELPCGSRVGVGVFTEYRSFLLLAPVEVCDNYRELKSLVTHVDHRMAWSGNSEVAKGLYSGLKVAAALPGRPALVFITDGHEAPPVSPRYRPSFDGEPGAVAGLIVGVGGDALMPIPKLDPSGHQVGQWDAQEVLQVDPRSLGRGGSVAGEQMIDEPGAAPVAPLPGATPGMEQLSSLREGYLRLLATETRLRYLRLAEAPGLQAALVDPALAHTQPARLALRAPLTALALLLVCGLYARAPLRTAAQRMEEAWRSHPASSRRMRLALAARAWLAQRR